MRPWILLLALLLLAAAPLPEGRLSLDLQRHLTGSDNLCLAPHSLADALLMVGEGAEGATRQEFEALLGPLDGPAAQARNLRLPVVSATRLWVDKAFPILPSYQSFCQNNFGAQAGQVDFRQPAEAIDQINAWAARQTEGKIDRLLNEDAVEANTVLVLTNATTLKAKWEHPFNPASSQEADFYPEGTPDKPVKVTLMSRTAAFPFLEESGLKVVEMPYQGDLSLIVALPEPGKIGQLQRDLTAQRLAGWMSRLKPQEEESVHVLFPRIEVRSDSVQLKSPLEKMGLKLAFSQRSDFSRLSPEGGQVYLSKVVQATVIRFDEAGTEAAAATAAVANLRNGAEHQFRADRPFLFFLVHRPTDTVLFSGRVMKP
jgi:serpin B